MTKSRQANGSTSAASSNTITAVTLQPGVYYFAQSASNTTVKIAACSGFSNATVITMNANSTRAAKAANAFSTNLPSTLGTLTSFTNASVYPAFVLFEP